MELLQQSSPLIDLYNALPMPNRFAVVDVGCSWGIAPVFHKLGGKLHVLGIDSWIDMIKRLSAENENPQIKYLEGFLELPFDHPFMKELGDKSNVHCDKWGADLHIRTSWNKSFQIRGQKNSADDFVNAPYSEKKLFLPNAMKETGFGTVEFFKMDIDGPDFMILQSLDGRFDEFGIIAACLEVFFDGTDSPFEHTFHNTDRFMRKNGFELFKINTPPKSFSSLPSRFSGMEPHTDTCFGKPLAGDVLYVKDICRDSKMAKAITTDKIINTILIYSLFGLPDCAAEVILLYRDKLENVFKTAEWLDALTEQCIELQNGFPKNTGSYQTYMERYQKDDPVFYMGDQDAGFASRYGVSHNKKMVFTDRILFQKKDRALSAIWQYNLYENVPKDERSTPHVATPFFKMECLPGKKQNVMCLTALWPENAEPVFFQLQDRSYNTLAQFCFYPENGNLCQHKFQLPGDLEEVRLEFESPMGGGGGGV
jgi:hypothetical protein